jgi:glutathione synthase/RimK-type ligase-like ATP-grasp enzyme
VLATTSVEIVDTGRECKLYNSLRLRKYNRQQDVAKLIDALGEHGAYAEVWLPKAGWRGKTYDLRIVVIAGRLSHTVMRTSDGPLTNLHLGNVRGNVAELMEQLPSTLRERTWETCQTVASVFSRSLYCGIDLMFTPRLDKHAVLEVNAFGDLLPNVLCDGLDTYGAELRALDSVASVFTNA